MRFGLRSVLGITLCVGVRHGYGPAGVEPSTRWFISANGTDTLGYDLFLPHDADIHPGWGVVFMHGGGFFTGSRDGTACQAYCRALAERGIAVVSIDYRLRQVGKGFHCDISILDKREAIRWAAEDLVAAIDAVGGNFPNGIIAAGSSAGGAEAVLDAVYAMPQSSLKAAISLAGGVEPPQVMEGHASACCTRHMRRPCALLHRPPPLLSSRECRCPPARRWWRARDRRVPTWNCMPFNTPGMN